jgi:hypothetical protein
VCCFLAENLQQTKININVGEKVSGLVYADNTILVINFESDTLRRFNGKSPYKELDKIFISDVDTERKVAEK